MVPCDLFCVVSMNGLNCDLFSLGSVWANILKLQNWLICNVKWTSNFSKFIIVELYLYYSSQWLFLITISNPQNGFYVHPPIHPPTHPSIHPPRTRLFGGWYGIYLLHKSKKSFFMGLIPTKLFLSQFISSPNFAQNYIISSATKALV